MKVASARAPQLLMLALLLALAFFPLMAGTFYLQLVTKILIMAIFAMSLDLLVGFTGLVSLGHAAFFGSGAYMLMVLSPEYQAADFWLSLALAVAVASLAALLIGALVLRSSGVYFIMATLAFAQMFYYYFTRAKAFGGSDGAYIYVKPDANLFGVKLLDLSSKVQFYYLCLALAAASYLLLATVLRSLFGRVLVGIKENEHRMRGLGYANFRFKLAAFVLAGALAGLAGYLDAAQFGFVNPDLFGWQLSGSVLMMVILGGMGTLYGPVLGAFALILLQDYLADTTRHWLLPMGLFIILIVLVLPHGLAGLMQFLPVGRQRPGQTRV